MWVVLSRSCTDLRRLLYYNYYHYGSPLYYFVGALNLALCVAPVLPGLVLGIIAIRRGDSRYGWIGVAACSIWPILVLVGCIILLILFSTNRLSW